MKKLLFFLILFYSALFLRAQEEEVENIPIKEPFRFKNRMVELSVVNVNLNVSNSFIAIGDVFESPFYMLGNINDIKDDPVLAYKNPVVINLDDFFSGYKFILGTGIKPFSLNFNWKDKWGFGLDVAHISVTGNVALAEELLSLKEARNEKFNMGMAAYVDVGIPIFFHYDDFKIKIRPAVYMPLIYTRPTITYTYKKEYKNPETGAEGSYLEVDYDMRVYSLVDMQQDDILQSLTDEAWNIPRNNLGYDFGLSVEYPWSYNLDIGVDIVNIPVPYATARLNHYTQLSGSMMVDTSRLDIDEVMDGDISKHAYNFKHNKQTYGYNSAGQKVYRPFSMLFYADYRPYDSRILSLIPSLGFSINSLYNEPGSVEGGLSARIDLANIFITTLGINYNDRAWKNSIDFVLNLRAFQLDLGLSSQAPTLVKSWQGAGVGVNFGMKFGW